MNPVCRLAFLLLMPGILNLSIAAQSASEPQPYSGSDIRETDPRVKEIRERYLAQNTAPPETWRLRYSGKRGDYLAFYDLEGRQVFYRYREDRFDRRAEKRVSDLIEGQAYNVRGKFTGLVLDGIFTSVGDEKFNEYFGNASSIPAYDYIDAAPLRFEQILY